MKLYDVIVEIPEGAVITVHTTENKSIAEKVKVIYEEEEPRDGYTFDIYEYEEQDWIA